MLQKEEEGTCLYDFHFFLIANRNQKICVLQPDKNVLHIHVSSKKMVCYGKLFDLGHYTPIAQQYNKMYLHECFFFLSVNYTSFLLPLPLACTHSISVGDMFHLSNNLFLFSGQTYWGRPNNNSLETTKTWNGMLFLYGMIMKLTVFCDARSSR